MFDIDMTDYDDVRKCCQEKQMCRKCWNYIVAAVKILDSILRLDFGFKHLLWVFSGRRGVHCWVADKRARILESGLRKSILAYIELNHYHHSESNNKKLSLLLNHGTTELHPMIKRSLSFAAPIFKKKILPEIFADNNLDDKMISALLLSPTPDVIRDTWKRERIEDPLERWKSIISIISSSVEKKQKYKAEEFILHYLYPRLDSNVSIGLNHLLKAPFCVHPDTGKICVPLDPSLIHEFDPETVPTIHMILSNDSSSCLLQPYLTLMDQFLDLLDSVNC